MKRTPCNIRNTLTRRHTNSQFLLFSHNETFFLDIKSHWFHPREFFLLLFFSFCCWKNRIHAIHALNKLSNIFSYFLFEVFLKTKIQKSIYFCFSFYDSVVCIETKGKIRTIAFSHNVPLKMVDIMEQYRNILYFCIASLLSHSLTLAGALSRSPTHSPPVCVCVWAKENIDFSAISHCGCVRMCAPSIHCEHNFFPPLIRQTHQHGKSNGKFHRECVSVWKNVFETPAEWVINLTISWWARERSRAVKGCACAQCR